MDKIKTVKLTPENQISVIELSNWDLQKRAEAIGADCIEIVKTQRMYDFFGDTVVMIVDESGLNNGKPISPIASYLYGVDLHGGLIAGDILLGVQRGPDIFPPDHAESLVHLLQLKFPVLQKK